MQAQPMCCNAANTWHIFDDYIYYLNLRCTLAGMDVVHMTACNISGRIRLSCDTRWQPAEDARDMRLSVWRSKSEH